jgi:hypothetical protein
MSMALAEWLGAGIAYDLFDTELPGEYAETLSGHLSMVPGCM